MIAADDDASVGARRFLRGDMAGGIDLETIGARRQIARRMQRMDMEDIALARAFQQTAALVWICGHGGGAQRIRHGRWKINAECQCAP